MSNRPSPAEHAANLKPAPIALGDIGASVRFGFDQFRTIPLLSVAFSALFVAIGLVMYAVLEFGQIAPMSLSLAGGFMLVV